MMRARLAAVWPAAAAPAHAVETVADVLTVQQAATVNGP